MHQKYSTIHQLIDKIGNIVSILLHKENNFLDCESSVKLLYKLDLMDLLFFFSKKNLKRPLAWKLHMKQERYKVAAKIAGDSLSKGDFRWIGAR